MLLKGAHASGMKNTFNYKMLLLLLTGLLAVAMGVFAVVLVDAWREVQAMRGREQAYAAQLTQARAEIERKQKYFDRLMNDQEFFERIVRQRLGYSRPDEIIFRFEKDDDSSRAN